VAEAEAEAEADSEYDLRTRTASSLFQPNVFMGFALKFIRFVVSSILLLTIYWDCLPNQ